MRFFLQILPKCTSVKVYLIGRLNSREILIRPMYPKLRDYTIRLAFVLTSFKGINCSLIGFLAGLAWRMRAIAKLFTNLYIMSHKIFF